VPCSRAVSDAQFYAAGWFGAIGSYASRGEPVPDFQWADAASSLPKISGAGGVAGARAKLRAMASRQLRGLQGPRRPGVSDANGNNAARARDATRWSFP